MKVVCLIALFGAMCWAGQDQKPACNAQSRGQFWPSEANSSQQAARQFYQQGELEMCSLVVWKYRWEHLSVNVRELAQGKRLATSLRATEKNSNRPVTEPVGR